MAYLKAHLEDVAEIQQNSRHIVSFQHKISVGSSDKRTLQGVRPVSPAVHIRGTHAGRIDSPPYIASNLKF